MEIGLRARFKALRKEFLDMPAHTKRWNELRSILSRENAKITFLIEDRPEGGFTASALGASIFTSGETLKHLEINIKDAVQTHFETAEDFPQPFDVFLPGKFYYIATWR